MPLPGYDKHGRKVLLQRFAVTDPNKATFDDIMRVNSMQTEVLLKDPDLQTSVCGVVIIQDGAGTTMAHMKSWSPAQGKKMTTIFEVRFIY